MGRSNSEPQDGIHKEIKSKEISDSEDHDSEALAVSTLVTIVVRGLIAYSEEVKDHSDIHSQNHAYTIQSGPGGAIVLDGLNGMARHPEVQLSSHHPEPWCTVMSRFYTVKANFKNYRETVGDGGDRHSLNTLPIIEALCRSQVGSASHIVVQPLSGCDRTLD